MPSLLGIFFLHMVEFHLSEYGSLSLRPSPINKMTESFSNDFREGIDINLGVGYVNDATIPDSELLECFNTVIHNPQKYRSPLNYGAASGSSNLHDAIKTFYSENNIGGLLNADFDNKSIVIGANGATSILDAISDILPKGIVFTAEPMYYIYTETLQRKGFTVCAIPEDSHGVIIEFLQKKLLEIPLQDISFFYFITVNNPSTHILENARKKRIVEIATELSIRRGFTIPVIFDKAYEDIIYDTTVEKPISGLLYDTIGNVIEVGTFSKIVAPALRIGYAIGQKSNLMQALTQSVNDVGFSAPLINQEIVACFIQTYISSHITRVKIGYKEKAEMLKSLILLHLGTHVEYVSGGKAGFYFYITFLDIQTHSQSDFFKFLSRTTGNTIIDGTINKNPRLVYVPGEICVSDNSAMMEIGKRQLRISFGFEDIQVLEKAILLIKEAIDYVKNKKSQQ